MIFSSAFAQSILSQPESIESPLKNPTAVSYEMLKSGVQSVLPPFVTSELLQKPQAASALQEVTQPLEFSIYKKAPPLQSQWQFLNSTLQDTAKNQLLTSFEAWTNLAQTSPLTALANLRNNPLYLNGEEERVLKIQIVYYLKQFAQAETLADQFIATFPQSAFVPQVSYFYHKSRSMQGKAWDLYKAIDPEKRRQLPVDQQAELLRMMGQNSAVRGEILQASQYFLQQRELALPSKQISAGTILKLLQVTEQEEILQTIEEEFAHVDFIKQEVPIMRLQLMLPEHRYEPALALIQTLLTEQTIQENPERLEYLLGVQKSINITLYVNPQRIGVILPLSSTNPQIARLTRETLEGLRLGLLSTEERSLLKEESLGPEDQPVAPFELVLRDSQLNAETSMAAVRELVEEEHVVAIIGPLIRRTSEAAAVEAQRLQVPLISLSLTTSIPDIGSYVFRNNQSWEQEMKALARYAVEYKNAQRFLILYPNTREGKNKMALFWDEIIRLGGTIQGGEMFELGQQDFVRQFEKFTGMDRFVPADELQIMDEFQEQLQPVHDFDMVFVPIGRSSIEDLKVLLPYAEVYQFQDIGFLGDSGWNDYSVIFAIQKYVQAPVFVDIFFKQNPEPQIQQFVSLHERYFFRPMNDLGPTSYTAYAYDTVNLLKKIITSLSAPTHLQLQQALLRMEPFPGVTGMITFQNNGEALREMKLLTIEAEKIIPVN